MSGKLLGLLWLRKIFGLSIIVFLLALLYHVVCGIWAVIEFFNAGILERFFTIVVFPQILFESLEPIFPFIPLFVGVVVVYIILQRVTDSMLQ